MRHDPSDLEIESLDNDVGMRVRWRQGPKAKSYAETLREWHGKPQSAIAFAEAVAAIPYESAYWECPVLSPFTADRPFECAVLEARSLHRRTPDPDAFSEKFATAPAGVSVVRFRNLGGGSVLVAPLPVVGLAAYGHLAAFVRKAPLDQVCAFFACVASCALEAGEDGPVWVSTAGDGIAWLHGRIDPYPKYYNFAPYKEGAPRLGL